MKSLIKNYVNKLTKEKLDGFAKKKDIYLNDNELEYTDLVTYVNASLDYKYYTNVVDIKEPDDILVLVNKYHKLASNYVPSDLETISSKYNQGWNNKMRHVAKEAF